MRVRIRDASYWYEVYGEGEAIVLLHGFTGSTNTWNQFIETYQHQFKIIVIDLPGHGQTLTPSITSMEQCCHDIHVLLNEIGIQQFHLLGYSMGGRTALSYSMFYPEQLTSLILESASPGLSSEEDRNNRKANDENLVQKIEREGVRAFVDFWENIPLFQSQKALPPKVKEAIRQERLGQSKEGLALSLRGMGTGSQPSWWTNLATFQKPVLLIVGELDDKFIRINQKMCEYLPNSEMRIVKKVGHAIHVEEPFIFGTIVKEFILADKIE
ncbi:2-succinyl-6-hydroxy-2,4-cyclohexadiene-1-carboxylate synthase [Ornithinibacillus sp. BX22]|uniref:Putative 2-succinyl-6-hydroxy-2,4-cyclohexadiene-1-carboxylate synthase n=1 Tax=Ornithinibacillus hominis TaxID=2763055 RepID=A0A923L872_9BACI|nr:2-succinyl-6-hydroxy-2,4-cyclohexadiene-1-carboxylate synthase [Ornithinibacillus hominis]